MTRAIQRSVQAGSVAGRMQHHALAAAFHREECVGCGDAVSTLEDVFHKAGVALRRSAPHESPKRTRNCTRTKRISIPPPPVRRE